MDKFGVALGHKKWNIGTVPHTDLLQIKLKEQQIFEYRKINLLQISLIGRY